jgi:hypothetical protein
MPETTRRSVVIEGVLAEHARLVDTALDRYLSQQYDPPDAVLPAACSNAGTAACSPAPSLRKSER